MLLSKQNSGNKNNQTRGKKNMTIEREKEEEREIQKKNDKY